MKEQIITSFISEGTFATQQRMLSFHGTMAFQSGAHQVHDKHLSVLFFQYKCCINTEPRNIILL